MYKTLAAQLQKLGITKAVGDYGTSEGYPAIYLRWNGESEAFCGYDELNPLDEEETRRKLDRFMDKNLGD